MNSLVKVFSNFKEFYSEINGATLTGAIDVIVVEQPDGTFACSPFHVRFGKLGVLRSREKVVDIEINGEPVDIQMKLGESGEAFFVEECSEGDLQELPHHMATSPIPTNEFQNYEESLKNAANSDIKVPLPRRNSIDISKDAIENDDGKYENQTSEYTQRRYTDDIGQRRDLSSTKVEFTTQKMREEWANEQEIEKNNLIKNMEDDSKQFRPINEDAQNDSDNQKEEVMIKPIVESPSTNSLNHQVIDEKTNSNNNNLVKEESKSKKKRRKKSLLKKKNNQRKSSTSSSTGSAHSDDKDQEAAENSMTISTVTNNSSSTGTPENEPILMSAEGPNKDVISEEPKKLEESSSNNRLRDLDIHFFSDTEVGYALSPNQSRPSTPVQSDTEFEVSQREKNGDVMTNSASWKWGELPTQAEENSNEANSTEEAKQAQRNSMLSGMFSFMKKTNKLRKNNPEGLYLSDLDAEGMDPEVAALYFPQLDKDNDKRRPEEDRESGNGTSLPQSPTSMEGNNKCIESEFDENKSDQFLNVIALSLCGGMEKGGPTDEEFESNVIQYNDICQDPSIFNSKKLVVRLNNKYYSWSIACPIVISFLAFQKPLPNDVFEKLANTLSMESDKLKTQDMIQQQQQQQPQENNRRGWFSGWRRSGGSASVSVSDKNPVKVEDSSAVGTQTSPLQSPDEKNLSIIDNIKENDIVDICVNSDKLVTSQMEDGNIIAQLKNSMSLNLNEKFRKTLRLSSDQIKMLNLKNGMNEIQFSVTTAYQGTTRAKCYLFKWKHNDKVVISDIDGTITKSDVLGHILPMVGKDWAQIGVAQLFSKIEENGYKMLYLSARAIGQSRATREYLRSIRQGDVKLPDGPLLLNPTSLMSAFHREVIERKPEQFKIECLSDIKALFSDKNPFYAGYGNRINDVWAYRAVGIPIMRIYTINPRGELKHELTQTFQSTYCSMTYIVDQLFPPIMKDDDDEDVEYSSFNYWRDPVDYIDLELDLNTLASRNSPENSLQVIQSSSLPTIPEN